MPFIMATALIDMISIGLIIPVLPALVGSFNPARSGPGLLVRRGDLHLRRREFFGSPILARCRTPSAAGRCADRLLRFPLNFFLPRSDLVLMLVAVRLCRGDAGQPVGRQRLRRDITPPEHGRSASA